MGIKSLLFISLTLSSFAHARPVKYCGMVMKGGGMVCLEGKTEYEYLTVYVPGGQRPWTWAILDSEFKKFEVKSNGEIETIYGGREQADKNGAQMTLKIVTRVPAPEPLILDQSGTFFFDGNRVGDPEFDFLEVPEEKPVKGPDLLAIN